MTGAEKLRQEMVLDAPFTKEEFIKVISGRIKNSTSGGVYFICDKHIKETRIKKRNKIRMNHEQAAIDYARSESFWVSYDHNRYGARYIVFTL